MNDHHDLVARGRKTIYGRRRGRPLRPGLRALIEDDLPALAISPDQVRGGPPAGLFDPPCSELWLEVGFGGGEHLAWQAARQAEIGSQVGLIGIDYFINGVASLLRRIKATPATERVRIYQGEAGELLDALPPASLDRVFILFPDPWPKRRHHKRRFIQETSVDRLAELMRPGAELRLASDDRGYVDWIMTHFHRHPAFDWLAESAAAWRCRPSDWPATRYEDKAVAAGRKPTYMRFRRNSRPVS